MNELIETQVKSATSESKPISEMSTDEIGSLVAQAKAQIGEAAYKALLSEWDQQEKEAATLKAEQEQKAREDEAKALHEGRLAHRDEILEQFKTVLVQANALLAKWIQEPTHINLDLAEDFIKELRGRMDTVVSNREIHKRRGR